MRWQNYFKLVYHPNPGHWYIHWLNGVSLGDPFAFKNTAEHWISLNYRYVLDYHFEKEFLE